MGSAAAAFLVHIGPYARLDPESLVWIAHHGPFSYSADDDGGGDASPGSASPATTMSSATT